MASRNKVGDKFLGEDGITRWEILRRENGRFVVRCVFGLTEKVSVHHLSAQKINALCNAGRLTRV